MADNPNTSTTTTETNTTGSVESPSEYRRFENQSTDTTPVETVSEPGPITPVVTARISADQQELRLKIDTKLMAEQERIRKANEGSDW